MSPSIVFLGTSEFGIPTFEALVRAHYSIKMIVTTPDAPKGRNKILTPSPIKEWALKNSISLYQPEKLILENWVKSVPGVDIYIVVSYGKIIPKDIFSLPPKGTINIHPSLLPLYRGPDPIRSPILNGEKSTGVTLMLTDEKVDHGNIIAQQNLPIDSADDITTLSNKLSKLAADLIIDTLPRWLGGAIIPTEQDHSKATFTKLIQKEDGHINWDQNSQSIIQHIKAYRGWPSSWSILKNTIGELRVKIIHASLTQKVSSSTKPGAIEIENSNFLVATKDTFLKIESIQPDGKSIMDADEFVRGRKLEGAYFQ